jgi:hypothetical protein
VEGAEIGGEGGDVVPVLGGVGAEVFAGEIASRPGLIERVREQVVGREALLKTAPESGVDVVTHERDSLSCLAGSGDSVPLKAVGWRVA